MKIEAERYVFKFIVLVCASEGGLLIGLGFSIHQEIWIPLLLLLIYSFNNYGYKKGARDLLLAALVFLLVNGYFIAQNPSAFFNDVFLPASGPIFPEAYAPFGYFILNSIGLPLSFFSLLPVLVLISLVLIFIYFNDRRLIPLFGLIPLLFLQRGLFVYFSSFLFFLFLTFFIESRGQNKTLVVNRYVELALICLM